MVEVVVRWPLISEVLLRFHASQWGVCGRQSATGTGFFPSNSARPCQCHSTTALDSFIFLCLLLIMLLSRTLYKFDFVVDMLKYTFFRLKGL
jgi:hypothetical protein